MKDKQLKVRLTESDHKAIKDTANSFGITVSDLVVKRCLGIKLDPSKLPKAITKKETVIKYSNVAQADPELIRQVALIGNNINQIARRLNQSDSITATELLFELQSISEQLQRLTDA